MKTRNLLRELDRYIRQHYRPDDRETRDFAGGMGPLCATGWSAAGGMRALDFFLKKLELSFSEKLIKLMEQKGRRPAEVYIRAGVTKSHFSKIKTDRDYHPTKETAFAFAVALYLNLAETEDLLKRAGYSISHSSKSDLIVEFCIKREIYDIDEVNNLLDKYGYKPLTNWRKLKDE